MAIQESGQMYLETIYVLTRKSDSVRAVDIAEHMNYSKPSVSRAIHLLHDEGMINIDDAGNIKLTDAGRSIAEEIYDRHTTITDLLISIGVSKKVAAEDACRVEHYISEETFAAIKRSIRKSGGRK